MAVLSDSDEGKDVVSRSGEKIGIVTKVEHGQAYVDPDPGITDELKADLGWGDRTEDTYAVDESDIASVDDREVHLERHQ